MKWAAKRHKQCPLFVGKHIKFWQPDHCHTDDIYRAIDDTVDRIQQEGNYTNQKCHCYIRHLFGFSLPSSFSHPQWWLPASASQEQAFQLLLDSCGKCHINHTSMTCKKKTPGHKDGGTYDNTMGGSQIFMDWQHGCEMITKIKLIILIHNSFHNNPYKLKMINTVADTGSTWHYFPPLLEYTHNQSEHLVIVLLPNGWHITSTKQQQSQSETYTRWIIYFKQWQHHSSWYVNYATLVVRQHLLKILYT